MTKFSNIYTNINCFDSDKKFIVHNLLALTLSVIFSVQNFKSNFKVIEVQSTSLYRECFVIQTFCRTQFCNMSGSVICIGH